MNLVFGILVLLGGTYYFGFLVGIIMALIAMNCTAKN